jgi:hypothetical protein
MGGSRLPDKAAHEFLYFRLISGPSRQISWVRDHPVRTACQTPVHPPVEARAVQLPPPELPESRPVPRTYLSPWTTVTLTPPAGVTLPETPAKSWDTTRPPITLMGKRKDESQLPERVTAVTLQVPSKL